MKEGRGKRVSGEEMYLPGEQESQISFSTVDQHDKKPTTEGKRREEISFVGSCL